MTSSINSTTGTSVVNLLGAGSGVDIKGLAQGLVDAEKAPQQALLDSAIKSSQSRISGYSAIMYSLGNLKDALAGLQDMSAIAAPSVQGDAGGSVAVSAAASATTGQHTVQALSLVQAQSSISGGFTDATSPLVNGGSAFTLTVSVAGVTTTLNLSGASLNAVRDAINNAVPAPGVVASVANTGSASSPYRLVLTATTAGLDGAFTVSSDDGNGNPVTALDLTRTPSSGDPQGIRQAAADAHLQVDGVDYWRKTNTFDDVVPGLSFRLQSTSSAPSTARITRDTSGFKGRLDKVISSFNELMTVLNTVSDPKSTVPDMGGTLVSENLVNQIRTAANQMITANASSTTSNDSIRALRDLGVAIQKDGKLAFEPGSGETRLNAALENHFDEVVRMLSNNADHTADNTYDSVLRSYKQSEKRGAAGDAVKTLINLMHRDGPLVQGSKSASDSISNLELRKADLDRRMQDILDRYTRQFAAMDALVGQMNSLKSSLQNQFDAMQAVYTNK